MLGALQHRATSRMDGALRTRAMEAAARPLGVGLLEDQAIQDRLEVAAGKPSIFRAATPGAAAVAFDDHIAPYRRSGYLTGLAVQPPAAKETRVFGLAGWLLDRYDQTWTAVTTSMAAVRHRTLRRVAGGYLLVAPLHAVVFVVTGWAAVDGRIDLGLLAVVLQASRELIDLGQTGNEEYQIDLGSGRFLRWPSCRPGSSAVAHAAPTGSCSAAGMPQRAIRFEGVTSPTRAPPRPCSTGSTWRSPPARRWPSWVPTERARPRWSSCWPACTSRAPAASPWTAWTCATWTLDPGGPAVRRLPGLRALRAPCSRQRGPGGALRMHDQDRLWTAVERSGSRQLIEALAEGMGHHPVAGLGRRRRPLRRREATGGPGPGPDGDGGGCGRARPRRAHGQPRRARRGRAVERVLDQTPGCTTILVSHRFSTVRRADRICVLDQGRQVELGTHHELLAAGGRYARMFRRQASHFDG